MIEDRPTPTYILTFQEVARMRGSLVYVRRRLSDGKALYVGSSIEGLARAFQGSHYKAHLAEGDVLEIYMTDQPRDLEDRLIRQERPELNAERRPVRSPSGVCVACGCQMSSIRGSAKAYCGPGCEKIFKQKEREELLVNQAAKQALADRADRDQRLQRMVETLAREVGLSPEDFV